MFRVSVEKKQTVRERERQTETLWFTIKGFGVVSAVSLVSRCPPLTRQ